MLQTLQRTEPKRRQARMFNKHLGSIINCDVSSNEEMLCRMGGVCPKAKGRKNILGTVSNQDPGGKESLGGVKG